MKLGKHIPVQEIHLGQEAILVPRAGALQQSGQPFPPDGMVASVTDYHFACAQRGYLTVYALPEATPPEADAPRAAPEDGAAAPEAALPPSESPASEDHKPEEPA